MAKILLKNEKSKGIFYLDFGGLIRIIWFPERPKFYLGFVGRQLITLRLS
jgi:hypothetical protein